MDNIEYYKSLISDEEVITALIKESKAREADPLREKTRVRPNLNFFQRTVTNLVTSNKRVGIKNESKVKKNRISKVHGRLKTPQTLIREIITTNKVQSKTEDKDPTQASYSTDIVSIEKISAENVDRYFDRVSQGDTDNKTTNSSTLINNNATKAKNIVFKFNFSKSSRVESTSATENVSENERPSSPVFERTKDDVISISSSSPLSSDCEIVQISESDSE